MSFFYVQVDVKNPVAVKPKKDLEELVYGV